MRENVFLTMASPPANLNTGTSSISYFAFAKKQQIAGTGGEKKTMTYFRLLLHLCKSIYKPLKLHFSINDKCNYLALAIKTCPY